MTVNVRLKKLNNRLNIREVNSKSVKNVKRGRGNYLVKTYRVRTAVTVNVRLNRLNNRLNIREVNNKNVKEIKSFCKPFRT